MKRSETYGKQRSGTYGKQRESEIYRAKTNTSLIFKYLRISTFHILKTWNV
ncbi:MAG: hypothetical protein FWF72_07025 [Paludibacter sp.]|nr:hypothetical protein [Paludibacter sp.]